MDPSRVVEKRAGSFGEALAALGVNLDKQGKGRPSFTDTMFRLWFKDISDLCNKAKESDSIDDDESMRNGTYSDLDVLLQKHGPQIWGMDHVQRQFHKNVLSAGESQYYLNELIYPRDKDRLARYPRRI
jgi:hypothetical protein